MGDTCLPGLQGFPVQITGWSSLTDKSNIVIPNDIQLQFSPANVPMTFNAQTGIISTNGTSTFFMSGTQYNVRIIRLCLPKQEGLANFSGTPVAEFQIWGTPSATSQTNTALAVLVIPVIQKPTETTAGQAILDAVTAKAVSLVRCIPVGDGVDVVKYVTCIETENNSRINIAVAYWSSGAAITQTMTRQIPLGTITGSTVVTQSLATPGIPNLIGARFLSSFTQSNDEARTKTNRIYNQVAGIGQPYISMVTVSATSPEFQSGFRLIRNFNQQARSGKQDTSEYKCISIDRRRDISDGKLLIDPKTGIRMDEEMQRAQEIQNETTSRAQPKIGAGDIWITVCITIGAILGITLAFAVLYGVFHFFLERKYLGYEALPENLQAALEVVKKSTPS
jgi:hypothetical protein